MGIFNKLLSFDLSDLSLEEFEPVRKSKKGNSLRVETVYELIDNPKPVTVVADLFVNGESVKKSLSAREVYLNEYAREERMNREKKVREAEQAGYPLSASEAFALHVAEDKKRLEAYRQIFEMKKHSRTRSA